MLLSLIVDIGVFVTLDHVVGEFEIAELGRWMRRGNDVVSNLLGTLGQVNARSISFHFLSNIVRRMKRFVGIVTELGPLS